MVAQTKEAHVRQLGRLLSRQRLSVANVVIVAKQERLPVSEVVRVYNEYQVSRQYCV